MTNIVFVGEDPGASGKTGMPLDPMRVGATGHRLAALLGLTPDDFLERTCRINLFSEYMGATWYAKKAAANALQLVASGLLRGRRVVLLGQKVWAAFDYPDALPFTCVGRESTMFFYLPHPSGLNRWYNDHANVEATEEFLRSLIDE